MNKHADADVLDLLQNSVPPADPTQVDLFKTFLGKYGQQAIELPS